ncbi:MAG TPA: hypothetical protein VKP61_06260 [Candidatus Acidoferrum sp.]|nr:hypothetical protein [Candidatus Acidoferrum sp.]
MSASEASSVALAPSSARLRLEKIFFPAMAVLIIAAMFLGFARTFFLAPMYHYHLPNLLVALHGVAFASWIALFAIQASLVAADRVDLHKKLGVFGAVLVGLVLIMGYAVMLEGLHRGIAFLGQDDAQVLALDLIGINVSLGMFTAGLLLRRNPASHKRLMLFGTIGMLGPAVARWPFAFIAAKPPLVGLVLQLFALATITFDLFTRRRVHRATWVGAASLFLVPLIAVPLSTMPSWHHLLASLKQLLTRF